MTEYDFEAVDLERGAELLDECGWIQQDNGSRDRGFCAVEAVRQATFERTGSHAARIGDPLTELLGLTSFVSLSPYTYSASGWTSTLHSHGVAGFNDTPGRTKEQVQDLLMEGAKKLRDLGR